MKTETVAMRRSERYMRLLVLGVLLPLMIVLLPCCGGWTPRACHEGDDRGPMR